MDLYFSYLVEYLTSDQDPAVEMRKENVTKTINKEHASYCPHYNRTSCQFKFECCEEEKFFPCHKCHNEFFETQYEDEVEDCSVVVQCQHPQVTSCGAISFKCTACDATSHTDKLSKKCNNCEATFAPYVCTKCKQVVNDKKLDPYHCDDCGTCRVNKSENFHCSKCNICLHKKMKSNHICLENSGHDLCGVCLEEVFGGCIVLPCSHKLHRKCLESLIQYGSLTCPNCRQCFVPDDKDEKPPWYSKIPFLSQIFCKSRNTNSTQIQNV